MAPETKVLTILGTSSHVGKSMLTTALCRNFKQDGYNVTPFKPVNMGLNSGVTPDGGEICRAQIVQAEAAGIDPSVLMNPILFKPTFGGKSQLIIRGKAVGDMDAQQYYQTNNGLWDVVTDSFDQLRAQYGLVVIEGSGAAVEPNMRDTELTNMRIARYARSPVLLVGDIDRGGVFASLLGTVGLMSDEDRKLIKGFVVNKFRGEQRYLQPAINELTQRTGIPTVGVIHHMWDLQLPEEDSVILEKSAASKQDHVLDAAVIKYPHISNFDDYDPLAAEAGVQVRYVDRQTELGNPDLLLLPGSKSTISDLWWLRQSGLAQRVLEHVKTGKALIGICGGFQMLGQRLKDPLHIESDELEVPGLGLLPISTVFEQVKATHQVSAQVLNDSGLLSGSQGMQIEGYEIHMGKIEKDSPSVLTITSRSGNPTAIPDGAIDATGMVLGTYLHGLFHNDQLRKTILANLARQKGVTLPQTETVSRDQIYDALAQRVRNNLDMDFIYQLLQ